MRLQTRYIEESIDESTQILTAVEHVLMKLSLFFLADIGIRQENLCKPHNTSDRVAQFMDDNIDHLGFHLIDEPFIRQIVENKQRTEVHSAADDGEIINTVVIDSV